jgi:hypothetical protein
MSERLQSSPSKIASTLQDTIPPVAAAVVGAARQIGAEGSVAIENGATFAESTPELTRTVINLWRGVERHADSNPAKFPQGFESFNSLEEVVEGAGMTVPGLVAAYTIDKALVMPIFERLEAQGKDCAAIKLAVRTALYTVLGQLSYELVSQNVGPWLHGILNSGDVVWSADTLVKLMEFTKIALPP